MSGLAYKKLPSPVCCVSPQAEPLHAMTQGDLWVVPPHRWAQAHMPSREAWRCTCWRCFSILVCVCVCFFTSTSPQALTAFFHPFTSHLNPSLEKSQGKEVASPFQGCRTEAPQVSRSKVTTPHIMYKNRIHI